MIGDHRNLSIGHSIHASSHGCMKWVKSRYNPRPPNYAVDRREPETLGKWFYRLQGYIAANSHQLVQEFFYPLFLFYLSDQTFHLKKPPSAAFSMGKRRGSSCWLLILTLISLKNMFQRKNTSPALRWLRNSK